MKRNETRSETPCRLAEIRAAQGLSQAELGLRSGVPQGTIAHIESGANDINNARAAIVARLAYALGVDITEILEPGWDRGLK